jgi:hypothetical protein
MSNEYPLHWPPEWPRSKQQTTSQFKTTLAGALKNVQESLRMFGTDSGKKVENVLISSNVTLGKQNPPDTGDKDKFDAVEKAYQKATAYLCR